ncbi:MAG: YigZ family protein [Desulfofustis sp.]
MLGPKGTAGRPMLQTLDHSGFGEVWVAVVRYFGGIKLGTGGLIRAYTSSVQQALEQVETIKKQPLLQFQLVLDYNLLPLFENLCLKSGVETVEKVFTDRVELIVSVPMASVDEFRHSVTRISSGTVHLKKQ